MWRWLFSGGVAWNLGFCSVSRIAFGATLVERNAQPQAPSAKASTNSFPKNMLVCKESMCDGSVRAPSAPEVLLVSNETLGDIKSILCVVSVIPLRQKYYFRQTRRSETPKAFYLYCLSALSAINTIVVERNARRCQKHSICNA